MRVSATHLDAMRARIEPFDTTERRETYRAGDFPRASSVKDLDKRYRWDLFYASGALNAIQTESARRDGSDYLDAHIDTALRQIVPKL